MTIDNIVPYFIIIGAVTLLAGTNALRFLDDPGLSAEHRYTSIDGLRGFLALSVMIGHAVVTYNWLRTGEWIAPHAKFYDQLGTLAVAIFFMITGYLFWGKMVRAKGRPSWTALYVGRIFRLGPVYLFAIAVMILIVMHRTGWSLHQPLPELLEAIAQWATLGFLTGPDFNGYTRVWLILA